MNRIIIKTSLITFGIVAGIAVVVFAVLSLGFPSTMAGWCEQSGNYSFAVRYAALSYSYSGDVSDLARCANDAVLAQDNSLIIKYGTLLIDDEDFDDYCQTADGEFSEKYPGISYSYRQYIYAVVAGACYENVDLQTALGFAIEALDEGFNREEFTLSEVLEYDITLNSFPLNNALGSLAINKVIVANDASSAEHLLAILKGVATDDEDEKEYLETIIEGLQNLNTSD